MERCYVPLEHLLRDRLGVAPSIQIEVIPALEVHFGCRHTWRMHVPGQGSYLGPVEDCWNEETGESHMAFGDADEFEAEN